MINIEDSKIAIIGLGYVGLPLAIEFGKKYKVLGFDINQARIEELKSGRDRTNEADLEGLRVAINLANEKENVGLRFSANMEELKSYNVL
jgi:UDP-N-acetyl-D-galactosamine dehydrogenase